MKSLLSNPIFIGGVIPMLLFGLWNFFYKPLSKSLPTSHLILFLAMGGIMTVVVLDFFTSKSLTSLSSGITKKHFYAFLLGCLWAGAIFSLAKGFAMGGNVSQIIPIVNANTLVTVILALLFLSEPVIGWKVTLGASLITLGSWFLV